MSEYQYYEFQTVDRSLTRAEMDELRALSTRAKISPRRFQNVYHFGDFRGEPLALMQQYFDAFIYVANWGTNWLMLRLPRRALDPETVYPYCVEEGLTLHVARDHVILEFVSQDEEGAGWIEDEEAESWLPALLPLRAELARGDLRGLYLAWLAGVRGGLLEDDEIEPPVPPGLRALSPALETLARFLRVDENLIAAAAERSSAQPAAPSPADLERWVRTLPQAEKDDLLVRLARGEPLDLGAERLRRAGAGATRGTTAPGARTVEALLAAADERTAARRRQEAEREAAERARQEREEAAARATYLDSLVGREEELWREVEALIEMARPKEYDRAVQLLRDLHDLGARQGCSAAFAARLGPLRRRHVRRSGLLNRLDRAGLRA